MMKTEKSKVVLDIGSYALKIMEVSSAKDAPVIKNIGVYERHGHSNEDLEKGIKSLYETSKIDAKEVSISVSGPAVVVRFIELPIMQDSEISQALPYEAEKYIPFAIKDVNMDFRVLERRPKAKKMKVLLVGVKKDFMKSRMDLLVDTGLVPKVVDVDAFAVYNAFTSSVPGDERIKKTIALVNIGDYLTNVIVACEDMPWMVRDINWGGTNIRQVLTEQLGIDVKAAEAFTHDSSGRTKEVEAALKVALQKLGEEIKLSCTYCENQYGKEIDEVYISGGVSGIDRIVSILEECTGIKIKQWDPLKPFDPDPNISKETLNKFRSSLAVCSGLALRN